MRPIEFQPKRKFIQSEKTLEKIHYRILIGLMIVAAAYYLIGPKKIGHDTRYSIYIFWVPTITGMLALGIYRRNFLINRFAANKGFFLRAFMIFFYLMQGLLFSYLSFGQLAKIGWDVSHYITVQENIAETFNCPITRFWLGHRPGVEFTFNGQHEMIRVKYSTLKDYKDKNAKDYFLKIKGTRGLWNYYTVNVWSIEEK